MHLETSLYIALQAAPELQRPVGWSIPDYASLARYWDAAVAVDGEHRKQILNFEAKTIDIGHDDDDDDFEDFDPAHEYGWDVERAFSRSLC